MIFRLVDSFPQRLTRLFSSTPASTNAELAIFAIDTDSPSILDGVFDAAAEGGEVFYPSSGLDATAIGEAQTAVRRRLLRAVERRGLLVADEAHIMAAWEHGGGFSVDTGVRIEVDDRAGLERLLR